MRVLLQNQSECGVTEVDYTESLQAMGYVRRDRAPTDERQVLVSLTPEGEQLRADAASVHASVVRRLAMTSAELDNLHHALEHVIQTTTRRTPGH